MHRGCCIFSGSDAFGAKCDALGEVLHLLSTRWGRRRQIDAHEQIQNNVSATTMMLPATIPSRKTYCTVLTFSFIITRPPIITKIG